MCDVFYALWLSLVFSRKFIYLRFFEDGVTGYLGIGFTLGYFRYDDAFISSIIVDEVGGAVLCFAIYSRGLNAVGGTEYVFMTWVAYIGRGYIIFFARNGDGLVRSAAITSIRIVL